MHTNDFKIRDFDAILDAKYGATGTEQREEFLQEARNYFMGQTLYDARREQHITQAELGMRIGANKSYISRIENGLIDPSISTVLKIVDALGLRLEIVRPLN